MSSTTEEILALALEQRQQAELFRYIERIEISHTLETPALRDCHNHYCFIASDGQPFFGPTYLEAVTKAMQHDQANSFFP